MVRTRESVFRVLLFALEAAVAPRRLGDDFVGDKFALNGADIFVARQPAPARESVDLTALRLQ